MDLYQLLSYARDYKPGAGKLSCAHFVSSALKDQGYSIPVVYVTTELFPYLKSRVKRPSYDQMKLGDIVFWGGTYDAVAPSGVGPEDTYTHVGIAVSDTEVLNFSSTLMKPSSKPISLFKQIYGPQSWLDEFATVKPEFCPPEAPKDQEMTFEVFYHDGKLSVKLGGKLYDVSSVYGTRGYLKFKQREE
jgi:hypothetical protein